MLTLAIDGGGVKGIAGLLILKRLFEEIRIKKGVTKLPLPCDYFDIIRGTSTRRVRKLTSWHFKLH